jgi:predicted small lipoprotein YifL
MRVSGSLSAGLAALWLVLAVFQGCGKKGPVVAPQKAKVVLKDVRLEVREAKVQITFRPPMGLMYLSSGGTIVAYELLRQEAQAEEALARARWKPVGRHGALEGTGVLPEYTFLDEALRPFWAYRYKVRAYNEEGFSEFESPALELTYLPPPPPPKIQRVEAGDGLIEVTLSYPEGLSEHARYHLYLFEAGKPAPKSPTTILSGPDLSYTFRGLKNKTLYTLIARSALLSGSVWIEGKSSEAAMATPKDVVPPFPPSSLQAVLTQNGVQLFWDSSKEPDVSGYRVYRSEGKGEFAPLNETPLPAVSYLDTGVVLGSMYHYRIVALDEAGNTSEPSGTVSVVFTKPPR